MGNNKSFHNDWDKSPEGGGSIFPFTPNWRGYIVNNRPKKKVETKLIGLILCDLLGVTGVANGLLSKIDSWKEFLIFVVAIIYFSARTVFYIIQKRQAVKKENFEQRQRELKVRSNGKY